MNLPRSDFRGRSILILELRSLAKNLKKFVNPTFTRTVPLDQLRRLLERHQDELLDFDLDIFDGEPDMARKAMEAFFARAEGDYPPGLIADLHRIAELGDRAGFELICQQARRFAVAMPSPARALAATIRSISRSGRFSMPRRSSRPRSSLSPISAKPASPSSPARRPGPKLSSTRRR